MKFFPPPKTPENAAYWPFESKEDMDRVDNDIRRTVEAVARSKSGYTFERFKGFLKDGIERSPELYGRKDEKGAELPKESNVERLKDVVSNVESVDWKLKAAGEDEEWDGAEIVEDQPE